jgi:hypothetical protein
MDEATLRRLAEDGLVGHGPDPDGGFAPSDLAGIAQWCRGDGEAKGKVSFVIVADGLQLAAAAWEDEEQGIPGAFAAELDQVIRRRLGDFLGEPDEEARVYLARSFREEIGLVSTSWQDWKAALFDEPPG